MPVLRRLVALVGASLVVLLLASPAQAFPWMIRHGYAGCVPCHADPSGAGLLTEYGRAQGDLILRSRFGDHGEPQEASRAAEFFWYWKTPEWLLLGVSRRDGLQVRVDPDAPSSNVGATFLLMQTDAKAEVKVSRFRASGTLGFLHQGGQGAWITGNVEGNNLASRQHWLGVDLGAEKNFLLRAGRIDVPFGIRQVEHEFAIRRATQTDINDTQQHGVALAYSGDPVRGELMAIAGNFQVNPDEFRQRGYSGYLELALDQHAAVGVSSKTTYARRDAQLGYGAVRMAHGAFARLTLARWAVVLAEADALVLLPTEKASAPIDKVGAVAMTQVDFEPIQGIHVMPTFEVLKAPEAGAASYDAWLSFVWFFTWHTDVRLDLVDTLLAAGASQVHTYVILPQLHAYF